MKKISVVIAALLLFTNLAVAGPDMDAAAKDTCKCLEAPQIQARKAMEMANKAQASGDTSQLMIAQGEMMGIMDASNRCFDALARKYPEITANKKLQDEVMADAEKQCPNPIFQMSVN